MLELVCLTPPDSCNSEIGQVLGILKTYGMNEVLQSCSSDEDNFFTIANVEFTASVVPSKRHRLTVSMALLV